MEPLVGCPDATANEIASAIDACCKNLKTPSGHVVPLKAVRTLEYNSQRDVYTVLTVHPETAVVKECKIEGPVVATLILGMRAHFGVKKMDSQMLVRAAESLGV